MNFLKRLLGRKEEKLVFKPTIDEETDIRIKGFTETSVETIAKKIGEKGRFDDFSGLLDYLEEIENTFVITKNGNLLGRYDEFPTYDMILDDFYDKWGGGVYQIKCLAPKNIKLGSYRMEGAEKNPLGDGEESEGKKKKSKRVYENPEDEIFFKELENNPKYKDMYIRNVLKSKGMKEDEEKGRKKSLEEIIAEKVEANPNLVDKLV